MKLFLLPSIVIALLGSYGIYQVLPQASPFDQEPKKPAKRTLEAPKTKTDAYFKPSAALNKKVDSIYNSLTDKQRAAQMIMTASSTAPKLGYPYAKALAMVKEGSVGNVVFLKGDMNSFTAQVKEMNSIPSMLKPLYACDCEPSLMNGKWAGSQPVKKANQQKTIQDIKDNTAIINKDMKKVGVQLNFAPVADNSINKAVISNRAFGADAKSIIDLSKAFISVSQEDNIGTSVKHFPGHGNVTGDSHKKLVFIDGELTELPTFQSIIQSTTPPYTVMVGHIAIKNNKKWNTNGLPSTISRNIITDLLRNELKYEGIITTDAMNMLGVAKVANADWKAVEAGVDLVLMPANPKTLNNQIASALQKKDAMSLQIEVSVKRIIRLKLVLGIV